MNITELHVQFGSRELDIALNGPLEVSAFTPSSTPADLASLVESQLSSPVGYPPVMASIVEGDSIALALEDGIPRGAAIVAEVARFLVKQGTAPEQISIVVGSSHRGRLDEIQSELQQRSVPEIALHLHDPNDHDAHAYVAASKDGDPIYVQRELIDADVLIPIYSARSASLPHASDPFGIAPTFTDAETQEKWNLAWIDDSTTDRHEHERMGREIGWLSGAHCAIVAVPATDGSLATLIAGQPEQIHAQAIQSIQRTGVQSLGACDVVMAIVEGPALQQNWLSVARAVTAAEPYCTPSARIVICCDVNHTSRGIRDLQSDDPIEQANRRLLKSKLEDAFAAAVLRLASYRRSIYLYAPLAEAETENLGLAYIKSKEDVSHLLQQSTNPCIVRAAQY